MAEHEFDPSKILDLGYCIQWAEKKIALSVDSPAGVALRHIRHEGERLFSVVDLMWAFGVYQNRKSAMDTWRKLQKNPPSSFTTLCGDRDVFWTTIAINGGLRVTDLCTLEDFLDRVLQHLSGDLAETMKLHRSRLATLVSTGSSLVAAINFHNSEAQHESKESKTIVDEVRLHTERLFLRSKVFSNADISSSNLRAHNVEVIYVNLPSGPTTYRRTSFSCVLPGYICATDEKLQKRVRKMGMSGDLSQRHIKYGLDGGFFDTIFTMKSYSDAQTAEASVNALTRPARTTFGREYFNADVYAKTYDIEDRTSGERRHMLSFISRYVEEVFVSTTRVVYCPKARDQLLQEYQEKETVSIPRPDVWRKASIFVRFEPVKDQSVDRGSNTVLPSDKVIKASPAPTTETAYRLFETGKLNFEQLKELLQLGNLMRPQ